MKVKFYALVIVAALIVTAMVVTQTSAQTANVELLFFTRPSDASCQEQQAIIETVAARYGDLTVITYDVTTPGSSGPALENGITTVPAIVIRGSAAVFRHQGLVSEADLETAVQNALVAGC